MRSSKSLSSRHYFLFSLLGALLLTILIYYPGLKGPFVYDDFVNIVQNDALNPPDFSPHSLLAAIFSMNAGPLKRPVSMLSFALERHFLGAHAYSFKVINLGIHLVNGALVFLLLYLLLTAYRKLHAPPSIQSLNWMVLAIGTLWLVHPLNLTAVLYIVQRETSLASLFMLAGITLYVWVRLRTIDGRGIHWSLYPGTMLFGALAVLSKETGALMPCYILAVEACLFRFQTKSPQERWVLWGYFGLFLLLPGLLALLWIFAFGHTGILSYAGRNFSLTERLLTETRVVWMYVFWTLIPRIDQLSLYHDDIPLSHDFLHPWTTLPACLGLAALIILAYMLRRRRPLVSLGIAWFFVGQLMESTVFPLQIAFEHRNYLADLGIMLAVMSLAFPMSRAAAMKGIRFAGCTLYIAVCAGVTLQRAWNWRSPETMAMTEAYYHPKSPNATYQLGQLYANLILAGNRPELFPQAEHVLLESLALPEPTIIPGSALAMLESQTGHPISPGLFNRMEYLLRTEHLSPPDTAGLYSLVNCYTHGHCILPEKDIENLFKAAFANPYLPENPGHAADLHVIYGNLLAGHQVHKLQQAREEMLKAVALNPGEPQYRINVVIVDLALEDIRLTEQDINALRRLNRFGILDDDIASLETDLEKLQSDKQHPAEPPRQHQFSKNEN